MVAPIEPEKPQEEKKSGIQQLQEALAMLDKLEKAKAKAEKLWGTEHPELEMILKAGIGAMALWKRSTELHQVWTDAYLLAASEEGVDSRECRERACLAAASYTACANELLEKVTTKAMGGCEG